MLRHWLRFVQPLALSFVVFTAAAIVFGQETPNSPNPPSDPAAAAKPENAPPAEAAKPAAEAAPAEAKPASAPAETPPSEAKPPEEPAKTEVKESPKAEPAEAPKPAETAEAKPAAAADATAAAAVFAAKLAEWKDVLKELQKLRMDYRTAAPDQVGGIQSKWNEATAKAEAMIEPLREAGKAAFAAAPNSDEVLTEFLIKILADDVARDNFEPAADLSKVLLDNGCDKKELYDPAGIAAFATNDFDAAEKRAKRAQDDGKLSENGKKYFDEIPNYKKYWQEEQEIRKKEAEQNDLPRVRLSTNKGDMVIELFENEAPETVGNFISLVEQKFYDGLVFHRVLPAFMAQGGCPRGDGTGDPGYKHFLRVLQG